VYTGDDGKGTKKRGKTVGIGPYYSYMHAPAIEMSVAPAHGYKRTVRTLEEMFIN
jgi:hypothetical protein